MFNRYFKLSILKPHFSSSFTPNCFPTVFILINNSSILLAILSKKLKVIFLSFTVYGYSINNLSGSTFKNHLRSNLLLLLIQFTIILNLKPTRLLCPWDSPDKNTRVGSHSLLQGIFLTQGKNLCLPHYRWIIYHLRH